MDIHKMATLIMIGVDIPSSVTATSLIPVVVKLMRTAEGLQGLSGAQRKSVVLSAVSSMFMHSISGVNIEDDTHSPSVVEVAESAMMLEIADSAIDQLIAIDKGGTNCIRINPHAGTVDCVCIVS